MKGRVPPPGRAFWDVDDHRRQLQLSGGRTTTLPKQQPSPRIKPPDWDSFVVQFPKDQIYHVPPEERNEFVQRLREQHSGAAKPYQTRACKITAAVVLIIALTIVLTTLSPLFAPKGPSFSVSRLTFRSHKSPNQSSSYRVAVRAKNPNEKMSMIYDSLGLAYLTFKGEPIASGNIPDLEQDPGRSSNVQLVLRGSEEELPKKVEKSLKDSRPKDLVLRMSFSVRLKLGFVKTKASETDVTCKLRVKSLRGATKILRQHCRT